MDWVVLFQVLQLVVLLTYLTADIIDDGGKKKAVPLINRKVTRAFQLFYLFLISVYAYVLIDIEWLSIPDLVALALTSLGTFLFVKAKWDLSAAHTPAGYHLESTKLIVKGVYSYIRHPLYTGASLFLVGSLLTMVAHLAWCLSLLLVAVSVFVMSSLAITARRETRILAATFGAEFLRYKERVHAFLPLHKYEGKKENE